LEEREADTIYEIMLSVSLHALLYGIYHLAKTFIPPLRPLFIMRRCLNTVISTILQSMHQFL